MLNEIASKASGYHGRPITERHVEKVLIAILKTSDPWEIVDLADMPLVYVADILRALKDLGYIELIDGVKLTEKGRRLVEELGLKYLNFSCPVCSGRGIIPPSDRLETYIEIARGRPEPIHERDQGYVTPVTAISRIALMVSRGDVAGKRILIIGDDDLMSLGLAITGLPKEIVVIEADKRLVEFINKRAKEYGFDIQVSQHDVRKPFPEDRKEYFDTFNTDPTETVPAIRAFVGRGIYAIKPRGAGYFGITRTESSLNKRLRHQEIIVKEFGCVITDLIHDFNHYVNRGYYEETRGRQELPIKLPPKKIRYKSSLYRIEKIKPGAGYNEPIEMGRDFYYDDEVATV